LDKRPRTHAGHLTNFGLAPRTVKNIAMPKTAETRFRANLLTEFVQRADGSAFLPRNAKLPVIFAGRFSR
jgi:hypothetical protein